MESIEPVRWGNRDFFYWIYGYWHAAAAVIDRERRKNPRVWEDLVTYTSVSWRSRTGKA
jgi:hypothetical protein